MIYFSQFEDIDALRGLSERYRAGLESYAFGTSEALDDLPAALAAFDAELGGCKKHGLSLHGPFFDLNPAAFDSLVREATRLRFEACYRAAQHISAARIVFHTGFYPQVYWEQSWQDNSIAFWKEFLADKDSSIAMHIENIYEKSFEPVARVIDTVAHPAFSACLDVGHAHVCSAQPVTDWIEGLGGRIGHIHLHNNSGKADEHRALDDGTLDMRALLERIVLRLPNASWTLEMCGAATLERSARWLEGLNLMGNQEAIFTPES